MKLFHIACGFSYSRVYNDLFSKFHEIGLEFDVYAPQHTYTDVDDVTPKKYPYSIKSEKIINRFDKLIYFTKIRKMYYSINEQFELSKFDLIHAHSLFSDGAIAYEIYKKYRIPYIVAIRNTDINQYYKKGLHLRPYAHKILLSASKVIFISESYRVKVLYKTLPEKGTQLIEKKSLVIPNGIDDYWLNQNIESKTKIDRNINLIFVGRIDANKNLESTIKAALWINKNGMNCNLTIIGDGPLRSTLEYKYKSDFVHFKGSIKEKEKLKQYYYENDVLVVPSFNETFGLVYIEAMSCGTPVIYSKGQAIDGLFPDGYIGKSINPHDYKDIANSIINIIDKYAGISRNCIYSITQFNWDEIAKRYLSTYKENLKRYVGKEGQIEH